MNLSKLVVAAVSIAAFALVWVPGRGSGSGSDVFGARTHRAFAHATVPDGRADAAGMHEPVEASAPDRVDALRTGAVPVLAPTVPTRVSPEGRARVANRSRPS